MTKEQLTKGRDLQDAILAAKENVKSLTDTTTDTTTHTTTHVFNRINDAVRFEINFYDDYRNRLATIESDGAEPEIVGKIKQVLLDYYTEKAAELEKEFANL